MSLDLAGKGVYAGGMRPLLVVVVVVVVGCLFALALAGCPSKDGGSDPAPVVNTNPLAPAGSYTFATTAQRIKTLTNDGTHWVLRIDSFDPAPPPGVPRIATVTVPGNISGTWAVQANPASTGITTVWVQVAVNAAGSGTVAAGDGTPANTWSFNLTSVSPVTTAPVAPVGGG